MEYVSNIDLNFHYGVYNIIDCGIRTGKTYWAVNNLKKFSRDGTLNRILFLVDTNSLKQSILEEYKDTCCEATEFWSHHSSWGENENKIGIMCYQKFGNLLLKNNKDFLKEIDCICWDECDSIFDFAATAFAKAKKDDFARKEATPEEILAVIQKYSSKKEYMPLILLGEWERIINEARIMCIGLSATPERAKTYYLSLTSNANVGKLQSVYRLGGNIYFYNLKEHLMKLKPEPGKGYWCYSPWIEENKNTVNLANSLGFNAIELHSMSNEEFPMTAEQKRVANIILTTGMIPIEYNFVVVNKAFERGFNIRDSRFNQLIINSTNLVAREQAARMVHPYQRALKVKYPVIPEEYLRVWLPLSKCRELAKELAVPVSDPRNKGKIMTWNALKEELGKFGYSYKTEKKKIDGKVQVMYYIDGNWIDKETIDEDFMSLVKAKECLTFFENCDIIEESKRGENFMFKVK